VMVLIWVALTAVFQVPKADIMERVMLRRCSFSRASVTWMSGLAGREDL
jgi:hypothetical protein